MPASVCVLGTVQGNVDTVPYHTQRLLKSAEVVAIFSARPFPDRRDQLSVMARRAASAIVARCDVTCGLLPPFCRHLRLTAPASRNASTLLCDRFDDHEKDLVGAFRDAAGAVR
jgi:hypothetical protein